ncbi:hypothetical protein KFL_000040320 [Klebsormidium nitens]|uniref:Protein PAM68, chloroplastic n=1 Tax=Klebsormidium nitens TaxID=105231 RepID=A0A1Y1HHA9_KLENI|nr:hypothetical protein KFL_000040320 [Klebsormidium nitens]|eukprot:GAQ77830.1 hypothetical protein KFL_000040320 [Klebsormidium nitens]
MATACSHSAVQSLSPVLPTHSSFPHSEGLQTSFSSSSSLSPSALFRPKSLQGRVVRRSLSVQARGRRRGSGVGFGPTPKVKKPRKQPLEDDPFRVPPPAETRGEENTDEGYLSDGDDTVPEVVTNRMLARMGVTVGIPLVLGLTFFPMFWYLKVIKHLEIPNWVPYFVSIFTFGAAAAGISYAILSVSWNPSQEGSALGWKEAQANWPVFWELLKNGGNSDKRRR